MTDDLRALFAAIVAAPADDTTRLAYADCLEERGNAARAEFIRHQIEAERLHPDSTARAAREDRAAALLAEHWTDWWGEVCAAVGLPVPVPQRAGVIGRLARRAGIANPPGHPYELTQLRVLPRAGRPYDTRLGGWSRATFRRGFPDSLEATLLPSGTRGPLLARWPTAGPLADLHLVAPYPEVWADGPHLAGVRRLTLWDFDPAVLRAAVGSPHLARLEDLTLFNGEYGDGNGVVEEFADNTAEEVGWLHPKRLTRLSLQVWTDRAAAAVADARHLASLTALEVHLLPESSDDFAGASRRLATLARSPSLGGLRELKVTGPMDEAGVEAALRDPTWTGLRKLEFDFQFSPGPADPFAGADDLPELEELRLSGVSYTVGMVNALVRASLLKRLRHFAVRGGPPLSVDFDIAAAVDADRIETFAIGGTEASPRVVAQLRDHFGDRLRVL